MTEQTTFEIRPASTDEELIQIADLSSRVFARRSYFDFYTKIIAYQREDPHYRPENSWIALDSERVVAHVMIVEKKVRIGRARLTIAGIGDVCAHPEYRRHGLAGRLMTHAVEAMARKPYGLSLLYGIPRYYERFGYSEMLAEHLTSIPGHLLPDIPPDEAIERRNWEERDREAVQALTEEEYENCPGMVDRSGYGYPFRLLGKNFHGYWRDGKLIGYLFLIDEYSNQFTVKELAAIDEPTRWLMLGEARRSPHH